MRNRWPQHISPQSTRSSSLVVFPSLHCSRHQATRRFAAKNDSLIGTPPERSIRDRLYLRELLRGWLDRGVFKQKFRWWLAITAVVRTPVPPQREDAGYCQQYDNMEVLHEIGCSVHMTFVTNFVPDGDSEPGPWRPVAKPSGQQFAKSPRIIMERRKKKSICELSLKNAWWGFGSQNLL